MRLISRRGFSLIELLVVIAIIALLMALLLPALQKVRDAGNKSLSSSNLGQIALAAHNFHNDVGAFPAVAQTVTAGGVNRIYSAFGAMLPYLDGKPIYDTGSTGTGHKVFVCPGRRTLQQALATSDYGFFVFPTAAGTGTTVNHVNRSIFQGGNSIGTITNGDGLENTMMLCHVGVTATGYTSSSNFPAWNNTTSPTTQAPNTTLARTFPRLQQDSGTLTVGRLGSPFIGSAPVAFGNRTMRAVRYSFSTNDAVSNTSAGTTRSLNTTAVGWANLWSFNEGAVVNMSTLEQ